MVIAVPIGHYPQNAAVSGFRKDLVDMAKVEKQAIRSADIRQVMDVVSRVYCPHELTLRNGGRNSHSSLEVIRGGDQPIVALRYGTPISVETDFRGLMLIQTCLEGGAVMAQGDASTNCHRDQTVPLSPGIGSTLQFDANFAQRSVRLDIAKIEALCARRIGAPLDRPLRFEFRPFSGELEQAWTQAVSLLVNYERNGVDLPKAASTHLDEFLLTLLLEKHPHNFSRELHGSVREPAPRLIREAEELMRTGSAELTASRIAAQLRVSMRTLEVGFHETRGMTPTQMLRQIRVERVRAELLKPRPDTSVTSSALAQGFFHLPRFSAYYRDRYGELPAQTLRRSRADS